MTASKKLKPIRRARSGCWACKARRRKCSEEKPACNGCTSRGLKCEYGLRLTWENDAREAGVAFGRAGISGNCIKKEPSEPAPAHFLLPVSHHRVVFLNTTLADVSRLCNVYEEPTTTVQLLVENDCDHSPQRSWFPTSFNWTPGPYRQMRVYPNLDNESGFIFDYYAKVVCHRKVLLDGKQNPFRHIILPLCSSSEVLLHAVIAASANDLRNSNDFVNNRRYVEKLLYHKSKSLKALCKLFEKCCDVLDPSIDEGVAERDSILLTVLMLCYLEIASGSRSEWRAHLQGALSIIEFYQGRYHRSATELFSPGTMAFVRDYFSLRDVFCLTALDQKDYFKSLKWHKQTNLPPLQQEWDEKTKINISLGLSQELLDIISATTSFARHKYQIRREKRSTYETESLNLASAVELQRRLTNLNQWSDETDQDHILYDNAAAFMEASQCYVLHAAYDNPVHHCSIQKSHLPRLLNLLQRIHSKHGANVCTSPYPMWALFIASCMVTEDDRATILGYFLDLKRCRPISNVPTTLAAVEAIWKVQDLNASSRTEKALDTGARICLDWEDALGKLGWKMSLT